MITGYRAVSGRPARFTLNNPLRSATLLPCSHENEKVAAALARDFLIMKVNMSKVP
jgi:hypothetical protein